jgi:hypothetical protein
MKQNKRLWITLPNIPPSVMRQYDVQLGIHHQGMRINISGEKGHDSILLAHDLKNLPEIYNLGFLPPIQEESLPAWIDYPTAFLSRQEKFAQIFTFFLIFA